MRTSIVGLCIFQKANEGRLSNQCKRCFVCQAALEMGYCRIRWLGLEMNTISTLSIQYMQVEGMDRRRTMCGVKRSFNESISSTFRTRSSNNGSRNRSIDAAYVSVHQRGTAAPYHLILIIILNLLKILLLRHRTTSILLRSGSRATLCSRVISILILIRLLDLCISLIIVVFVAFGLFVIVGDFDWLLCAGFLLRGCCISLGMGGQRSMGCWVHVRGASAATSPSSSSSSSSSETASSLSSYSSSLRWMSG